MDILQKFIQDGFVEVDINNDSLHSSINDKLLDLCEDGFAPRTNNEELIEAVPELSTEILYHPDVVSSVKILLGENYTEHPHKEVFSDEYTPNSTPHRDWNTYYSSGHKWRRRRIFYFNPWNLHHHCRYLHVFYYPFLLENSRRGTVFLPGSQYYNSVRGFNKYYSEPARIRSRGKVVLAHRDLFHFSSPPRLQVDKKRLLVKFILMRTEEPVPVTVPELPESWDGIYDEQVYNYHWNWYHGNKYSFADYDSSSYVNTLENVIENSKDVVNFTYSMAGADDSETLIEHINSIVIKENTFPREEILSDILALDNSKDLLLAEIEKNLMWNKKAAFIDILSNRAESFVRSGNSILSDQWINWIGSETSGYTLKNLIYGAPLICQGVDDALNAIVDRFKNPRLVGRGEDRIFQESMLSMLKLSKTCEVIPDIESKLIELSGSRNYIVNYFSNYLRKKWFLA